MWSRTTDKGCMWHKASLISLKLVGKTNPIENWDKGMNCFEAEGRKEPACRLYSQHLCCEAQANHCLTEAALQKLTGLSLSIRQNLRLLFSSCWGSWWPALRNSVQVRDFTTTRSEVEGGLHTRQLKNLSGFTFFLPWVPLSPIIPNSLSNGYVLKLFKSYDEVYV